MVSQPCGVSTKVAISLPLCASHTLTVLSQLPDASRPSSLHATDILGRIMRREIGLLGLRQRPKVCPLRLEVRHGVQPSLSQYS